MNTGSPFDHPGPGPGRHPDEAFDARLRAVHAQAVAATPAHVRLQLRPRRAGGAVRRGWSMAAAFAVGLVAVGLLWQRPSPVTRAPAEGGPVAATSIPASTPVRASAESADALDLDDAYAALDESPDFYLWLASNDASALLDDAGDGAAVTE